jgi:hypothetical protein
MPPAVVADAAGDNRVPMTVETDPLGTWPASLSNAALFRKFGVTLVKAYTYILGFFALIGLWRWWRVYLRRDHQTLLLMTLGLLALIWIRSATVRGDIRYFFPMVLVSFPWIALGLLKLCEWMARFTSWACVWTPRRRCALLLALVVVTSLLSGAETNLTSAQFMRAHVTLGRWIGEQFGPNRTIIGNIRETRLVLYYSQGNLAGYLDPCLCGGKELPPAIGVNRPDILLLWTNPGNRDSWNRFADTVAAKPELGYRLVARDKLPPGLDNIVVLARGTLVP